MADSPVGDGENVFLATSDVENFERTVASPAAVEEHSDRPAALESLSSARLWAAPEGSRGVEAFERMGPGDLVLFYRDGTYVGVGRVGLTFEDADGWVAETLWEEMPAEHVFTVTDFVPLSVERAAVNRLFDYGPGYAPSGLMRVAPDRVPARLASIELALTRFDEGQT